MKSKSVFFVLVLVLLGWGCGGGSGPEAVLDRYASSWENLANALEKADSAEGVASAFNSFSDKIEALIPAMNSMYEKHPEVKNLGKGGEEITAAYQPIMDRIMKATEMMQKSMVKLGLYSQEESLQKAQRRFTEVMSRISQ